MFAYNYIQGAVPPCRIVMCSLPDVVAYILAVWIMHVSGSMPEPVFSTNTFKVKSFSGRDAKGHWHLEHIPFKFGWHSFCYIYTP